MPSSPPNITVLTSDYDSIERAIRETARGRWFLHCYLERNRSSETRMLLDAISRLEGAMRDNGHTVEALQPAEIVGRVSEAIGEARADIARMTSTEGAVVTLPVQRFSFGSIPRSVSATAQAIREAAMTIESAASALRGAGVFQGVARQITDKTDEILRACAVQDQAIQQMARLAEVISEIDAEVMAAVDGLGSDDDPMTGAAMHNMPDNDDTAGLSIPDGVMKELSLALSGPALSGDAMSSSEPV